MAPRFGPLTLQQAAASLLRRQPSPPLTRAEEHETLRQAAASLLLARAGEREQLRVERATAALLLAPAGEREQLRVQQAAAALSRCQPSPPARAGEHEGGSIGPAVRQATMEHLMPSPSATRPSPESRIRQIVRGRFQRREPSPPPPPPERGMTTLETVVAALAFGSVAGVKYLEERSRVPALPPPTPTPAPARVSAPEPVAVAVPSLLSWDVILAFCAPIAAGVAILALWRKSTLVELENIRLRSSIFQLGRRQAEFKSLLGALRAEIGGVHQIFAQLERRAEDRDTRAAQAERVRDQRARQAEAQRDQAAREADERRDRRAEQLEARRSEGYVAALAHNTRELTRVLAEEREKLDKMNDHIEWMQAMRRDAPTPTEARELDKQIVDAKQEVQAIYDDLDYLSSLC